MKPSLPRPCHRQTSSLPKTHTCMHACMHLEARTHAHMHTPWHDLSGYLPAQLFHTVSGHVSWLHDRSVAFIRLCISDAAPDAVRRTVLDSGCEVRGKSCLSSVAFCSAQTDARACVNDSLSPRMSAGCRAACYSLQVKCLWRHMEQGKLTTRGNSPEQQEAC